MKRFASIVLILVLVLALALPAVAEDYANIYDGTGMLGSEKMRTLGEQTYPGIAEDTGIDVRVDIVTDTEGNTLTDYAGIFYDQYGYGVGNDHDGVLLMICAYDDGSTVVPQDWVLYPVGSAVALLDAGGEQLQAKLGAYLDPDKWSDYDAASANCLSALVYFGNSITAMAGGTPVQTAEQAPAQDAVQLVIDQAGLLTQEQAAALNQRANELQNQYGVALNVMTVDDGSIGSRTIREYGKDLLFDNELGYGPDQDCVLFLVDMSSRQYVTITHGAKAIAAYTDYGIDQMEAQLVPSLSGGDYNAAFTAFYDLGAQYLAQWSQGTPFDKVGYQADYDYMQDESGGFTFTNLLIGLAVGLVAALITLGVLKSRMKSAQVSQEASAYIPEGGFQLTGQSDVYLYTTETRTYNPPSESSDSGGSSVDSSGCGGSDGGSF